MDLEGRMGRTERRLDATLKIVQIGMKLLVKMQQETREFKKEMREFKEETRSGIDALIAAQVRSEARQDRLDARADRLVDALLRMRSNGRNN
jgi:hypothetical protein